MGDTETIIKWVAGGVFGLLVTGGVAAAAVKHFFVRKITSAEADSIRAKTDDLRHKTESEEDKSDLELLDRSAETIKKLITQNQTIVDENISLQGRISDLMRALADLKKTLEEREAENRQLRSTIIDLSNNEVRLQREPDALKVRVAELEKSRR